MEYITSNKRGRKLAFENIKQKELSNGAVWGDFVQEDFVRWDFVLGGILSGGFVWGYFVLEPFSTSGGYHECIGGISCVNRGDIMCTWGDVQYMGVFNRN